MKAQDLVDRARSLQPIDPKEWARKLKEAEERGEPLCPSQRRAWRQALGIEIERATA
jgi:hypothetical protein